MYKGMVGCIRTSYDVCEVWWLWKGLSECESVVKVGRGGLGGGLVGRPMVLNA